MKPRKRASNWMKKAYRKYFTARGAHLSRQARRRAKDGLRSTYYSGFQKIPTFLGVEMVRFSGGYFTRPCRPVRIESTYRSLWGTPVASAMTGSPFSLDK